MPSRRCASTDLPRGSADGIDDGSYWSGSASYGTWGTYDSYDYAEAAFDYESCGFETGDATVNVVSSTDNTSTLPCDGSVVDVWTIEATAGDELAVGVDTIAADTAFDTWLTVVGPDGCIAGNSDDSFDCTFAPLDWQCSSTAFTAAETGTYSVFVGSFDSCTGEEGAYAVETIIVD